MSRVHSRRARELVLRLPGDVCLDVLTLNENEWVDLEIELLARMRAELDAHEEECERVPKAILLNPANYELLGWDEFLGLPVLPDPRVEPMKAKLLCGDSGWGGFFGGEPVWWTSDGSACRMVPEEPGLTG